MQFGHGNVSNQMAAAKEMDGTHYTIPGISNTKKPQSRI